MQHSTTEPLPVIPRPPRGALCTVVVLTWAGLALLTAIVQVVLLWRIADTDPPIKTPASVIERAWTAPTQPAQPKPRSLVR